MPTQGVVSQIETRTVTARGRPAKVYDVWVDTTKYGWGFKNPADLGISVGTEIEFEFTTDQYGMKITQPVTITGQGKPTVTPPSNVVPMKRDNVTGNTRDRGTFPIPKTSGEFAIIRQNALTNAREMIMSKIMDPKIGSGESYIAESDEELAERIIKIANIFADYSSGQREVQAAERLVKKHTKPTSAKDAQQAVSRLLSDYDGEEEETEDPAEKSKG